MLIGIAAAVGMQACDKAKGPGDPTLRAILADPMASFRPKDARLLSSFGLEGSDGFPEASSTFLSRLFALPDQARADAAQRSLHQRARAGGWDTEVRASGDLVHGWKELGHPGNHLWAELTIGDYTEKGVVRVTVRIEDCRCIPSH